MNEMREGKLEVKRWSMREIIECVKSQASLVRVCEGYGIKLIKRGAGYICQCPVHPETRPSCTIHPTTNTFYCFGCSAHGDVIKFVQKRENLEFMPALIKLARMVGIDILSLIKDGPDPSPQRLHEVLELSAGFYCQTLKDRLESHDPILEAFFHDRGIVKESVDRFRIGFAPSNDELVTYLLETRGFHPDEVLAARIIERDVSGDLNPFFRNRVIFPFMKDGTTIYITGRSINQTMPKHLNLPIGEVFKKTIYNYEALGSAAKDIFITEGVIDCIIAEQMGFSAIALAGIAASDDLAKLLNNKRAYIAFDSEESGAGQRGAEKLALDLFLKEKESRIVIFPRRPGVTKVDLADFLLSEGRDRLLSLIKDAPDLIDLKIQHAARENEDGRIGFIRSEIFPLICHPQIREMKRVSYLLSIKDELKLKTDMFNALKKEAIEKRKTWRSDHSVEVLTKQGHELTEQEREEALRYLKDPSLIQNLVKDVCAIGIVGENKNALVLYLLSLTRKTERPISAVVFGDSSAGKSYLVSSICSLIPEEDLLVLSSASARSFEHATEEQLKHKFIVVLEIEGMEQVEPTIRIMQSEGKLARFFATKNEETGRIETIHNDVECPACIITTTTRDRVHPENSTRVFELYVNESPEQTAQIHELDREKVTRGWAEKEKRMALTKALHKNIQRVITDVKVVIPFSKHINFPKESIRSRRDFPRFLDLIKAVSLIRQYQKTQTKTSDGIDYIEADLEDYGVAYELAVKLFESTFSPISERARDVLKVCVEIEKDKFTREDIRQKASELGIHVSVNNKTLASQLRSLCEDIEALELLEGSQGKTCVYGKKIFSLEGMNGSNVSLIPTRDEIAAKIEREEKEKEPAPELGYTGKD